jgi:hypothetical protein
MSSSPQGASGPVIPIIASAFWGLLLLPGSLGAALSPMFFDAPGSMNNPVAWINALIVVSFPCLCIVSIAGVWIVWALHKRKPSRATSYAQFAAAGLPLLPILYVVGAMVVEMAGVVLSGQPMGLHSTVIEH